MSLSILLALLALSCASASQQSPEVTTPVGTFRGKVVTSFGGQDYVSYKGIPYALPPTGDRRFALPEPYPVIKGIYDATQFGSVCLQNQFGAILGKEDCLNLNVYTPLKGKETRSAELKKVLVYIHGGAWILGSSNLYPPGDLVTKGDVIVVTLNYRLNWFGFLRGNSSSLPGNLGYKDQILALQWVKDNIRHFGGDPNDVTLSGESAGSFSTALQSISPLSKGLFTKAVLLSGGIIHFPVPSRTSNDLLQLAADKFGCGVGSVTGNEETVIACLKRLQAETFVEELSFPYPVSTSSGDDFLPRSPLELKEDPEYLSDVGFFSRDYIVSVTAEDGYILANSPLGKLDMTSLRASAQGLNTWLQLPRKVSELVLQEYEKLYGGLEKAVINLATDIFFLNDSVVFLEAYGSRQEQGESPTRNNAYFMWFDHTPKYVPHQYMLHGLDLVYLFDINPKEFIEGFYFIKLEDIFYEEDVDMKAQFIDLVTGFMKTRNPTENLKGVVWPPYEPDKKNYLSFSLQPSVHEDILRDKRVIWETLVPQWLKEQQLSDSKEEL